MTRRQPSHSNDDQPLDGRTLPRRYYTSESIFGEEREKLFWQHWFCVGRRDALSAPGRYVQSDVAGQSIICTLDGDGVARAFYNTCRHRGTRLTEQPSGSFNGCRIQCPYHSWTYSCRGDLLAAPRADEDPAFRLQDWPLHAVAIDEWQGFLFVNLGDPSSPIGEAFASFWDRISAWQVSRLEVAHTVEYELSTNWKLVLENFNECYHCPSVHPVLAQLSPPRSAKNDLTRGLLLGGPMELAKESMTIDGSRCCPPIDTLDAQDARRTYYYSLFPNLMLGLHPEFVVAWRLAPLAPNRTRIVCEWLFQPESIERPDFDPAGAIEFWEMTNRQDWKVCEESFAGISSRGYQPGPLSPNESVLKTLDRQILTALGHDGKRPVSAKSSRPAEDRGSDSSR